ncbi:hypothetical protein IAU59_006064 [Kwoniella sp. CBS 9459]
MSDTTQPAHIHDLVTTNYYDVHSETIQIDEDQQDKEKRQEETVARETAKVEGDSMVANVHQVHEGKATEGEKSRKRTSEEKEQPTEREKKRKEENDSGAPRGYGRMGTWVYPYALWPPAIEPEVPLDSRQFADWNPYSEGLPDDAYSTPTAIGMALESKRRKAEAAAKAEQAARAEESAKADEASRSN